MKSLLGTILCARWVRVIQNHHQPTPQIREWQKAYEFKRKYIARADSWRDSQFEKIEEIQNAVKSVERPSTPNTHITTIKYPQEHKCKKIQVTKDTNRSDNLDAKTTLQVSWGEELRHRARAASMAWPGMTALGIGSRSQRAGKHVCRDAARAWARCDHQNCRCSCRVRAVFP